MTCPRCGKPLVIDSLGLAEDWTCLRCGPVKVLIPPSEYRQRKEIYGQLVTHPR